MAEATNDPETLDGGGVVDITPSPRILKLIAEIEFSGWQCIAELVDNSFDELLSIARSGESWGEDLAVSVSLPGPGISMADAQIVIEDNGRGMSIDQVRDAVRAGYTGKDPLNNLGLFGMGFNVSTARLGGVTRFLTTRAGDPEWIGVEIDVDNMADGFRVPVITEEKESPQDHGTRIVIGRLRKTAQPLTKPPNQSKLRKQLGGIYAHLIANEGLKLAVNGIEVEPWRHCTWDATRSVTRSGERIPAIIQIDEELGRRSVCSRCGQWQDVANDECDECGSRDLEERVRRVHGWVGIARDVDQREYGIDFLRNGRKIIRFDKEIFRWTDPDDPTGTGDVEYPNEVPANAGRIVGEIHLDHVRVTYTKDAFDAADPSWVAAKRLLRGEGPLLPKKAAALGYGRNDSPLARLVRGYRRNDPGFDYLMPGTGAEKRARLDTSDWVKKFHDGDPEYQTDAKWWEAIEAHETAVKARLDAKRRAESDSVEDEDPTAEFAGGDDADAEDADDDFSSEPGADDDDDAGSRELTEAERVERLLESAIPLPELTGEFSAAGVASRPIALKAFAVSSPLAIDGTAVPVWIAPGERGSFVAFVDTTHALFKSFDDEPEDVLLMEIAQSLIARATRATAVPLSAVFAELKDRHLQAHAIEASRLIPEAGSLMHEVQGRMVACIEDANPERPWHVLTPAEHETAQERAIEDLQVASIDDLLFTGEYLRYVPPMVIPRVIEEWPEAFFDGNLFSRPYADVAAPAARRQAVASVTGYLADVAWLAGNPLDPSRERMIRARLSLKLLPAEFSGSGDDSD